jgi:hypothetical protein
MLEDSLTQKDCEIAFIESNVASASVKSPSAAAAAISGGADSVREMVFPEFVSALFRLAHRKYAAMGWTLAREFEELLSKHILTVAEEHYRLDYGSLAWLALAFEREDVHKVVVGASVSLRDAYYAAAAPDVSLTYERLRVAFSKSRIAQFIELSNHTMLIKRAFLLGSSVEPTITNANGIVVTQDIFRNVLALMCRFVARALTRAKTPPAALVPLCSALASSVVNGDQDEPNGIATAMKAYLEATLEDISARAPVRTGRKKK